MNSWNKIFWKKNWHVLTTLKSLILPKEMLCKNRTFCKGKWQSFLLLVFFQILPSFTYIFLTKYPGVGNSCHPPNCIFFTKNPRGGNYYPPFYYSRTKGSYRKECVIFSFSLRFFEWRVVRSGTFYSRKDIDRENLSYTLNIFV